MRLITLMASALLASVSIVHANVNSLVGDKDGYGVPGAPAVPADGTLFSTQLGGSFFTDYRSASDIANAPFTDRWDAYTSLAYTHTYALGGQTPVSGTLSLQIAGIHDIDTVSVYTVSAGGLPVGVIPANLNTNGFQESRIYTFAVPAAVLTGSTPVSISFPGSSGDGFIVNYAELAIVTTPEPASAAVVGVVGLLALRRRAGSR